MWDPLLNEFPETVHGFRCMLAMKFLKLVEETYSRDTLGYDLISDLISVVRARNYDEASRRYHNFNARIQGTTSSQLRQPVCEPCLCPHCPRHQGKGMGEQAHGRKAQNIQIVQKSRRSEGM
ncbi:pre-coat protein [Begomovirus andrographis]|uniref:Protein V2 n=1 Tax=Begomovirus andrographis TaxID=1738045 RepID=A0A088SIJ9_9GEMI|nr:pre-coat protein [Andrographis yellow vein leaf curl virus]AIO11237.1 pre-coat protein [Andrographis yellow vein leaf curl virus]